MRKIKEGENVSDNVELEYSSKGIAVSSSKRNLVKGTSGRIHPLGDDSEEEDKRKDNEYKFRLEVKDSGAGISPENQKKLFGQYVQFNAGKLQKGNGSGLGLWISKGIIELHEGVLDIYSEGEGTGSTFFVELPLSLRDRDRQQPAKSMWLPTMRNPTIKTGGGSNDTTLHTVMTTRNNSAMNSNSGKGFSRSVRHAINAGKLPEVTSIVPQSPCVTPQRRQSSVLLTLATSYRRTSNTIEQANIIKEDDEDAHNSDDVTAIEDSSIITYQTVLNDEKPTFRSLQIYLVDDSGIGRNMLRRILLTQGHRVSEAVDGIDLVRKMEMILESKKSGKQNEIRGASAVEVTTSLETPYTGVKWDKSLFNIDVILIDDNMPEMSGPVATKVLRHRGYDGMIIGVTGNTLPEDIANFKNHGASHVYSKPLSKEKLTDIFALC